MESWNGSTWSVVPSPSPGGLTFIDVLGDVSCVSATFCIAVGSYGPGELNRSLIESWNGSVWSVMPSPRLRTHSDAVLNTVDCLEVKDCMGVGNYLTPRGQRRTLAATWNGTTWTVLPTPNRGHINNVNDANSLAGVSCLSASACNAVGSWSTAQGVPRTLIESWNGTSWSIVPSPNKGPASDFNSLGGISCPSASFCITVGSYANINAQAHTLAEAGTPAYADPVRPWQTAAVPSAGEWHADR